MGVRHGLHSRKGMPLGKLAGELFAEPVTGRKLHHQQQHTLETGIGGFDDTLAAGNPGSTMSPRHPRASRLARHLGRLSGLLLTLACTQTLAQANRTEYLQRFDQDGDGRVSLHEYQQYMSRGFQAMDRNGDGVLSADELPAGVHWRGPITLTAHLQALARTFMRLDSNGDGYLDARELTAPPP